MRKVVLLVVLLVMVLLLVGCMPNSTNLAENPGEDDKVYGFWAGLWHGLIVPITFIVNLFDKNVNIYEVHNKGGLYNIGFILGFIGTNELRVLLPHLLEL